MASIPANDIACHVQGCEVIVRYVLTSLHSWNSWSIASKAFASAFGAFVAALGVAVASKQLPNRWHWVASALFAGGLFSMELLQPYEEYKQFRSASASLELAYLEFAASKGEKEDLDRLVTAQFTAREYLKETWSSPTIAK